MLLANSSGESGGGETGPSLAELHAWAEGGDPRLELIAKKVLAERQAAAEEAWAAAVEEAKAEVEQSSACVDVVEVAVDRPHEVEGEHVVVEASPPRQVDATERSRDQEGQVQDIESEKIAKYRQWVAGRDVKLRGIAVKELRRAGVAVEEGPPSPRPGVGGGPVDARHVPAPRARHGGATPVMPAGFLARYTRGTFWEFA